MCMNVIDPETIGQISDQTSIVAIESGLEISTVEYVVDTDTSKPVQPFVVKRRNAVSAAWAAHEVEEHGDVIAIAIPKAMRVYPCVPGRMRAVGAVSYIYDYIYIYVSHG